MAINWKEIFMRYTSRKFLMAVAASLAAYQMAGVDGIYTFQEILVILTPLMTFIGAEGWADANSRSVSPIVQTAGNVTVEDQTKPDPKDLGD